MNNKYNINLLQPELLPKTPPLTLARVFMVWAGILIVMIVITLLVHRNFQAVSLQHTQLTHIAAKQNTLLTNLEQQIMAHKPDPQLAAQLVTLKTVFKYKQALQRQLTNKSSAYVAGFSGAMTELAQYHQADIRLERVMINSQQMTYIGVAKTPDAVPLWLAGFEHSTLLSGMSFSHFKLSENKQHLTDFVVSSAIPVGEH